MHQNESVPEHGAGTAVLETRTAGNIGPRLAVVVPIFRHSVLLCEAIESVLAQKADFGIHVVLVNDGCPFEETDAVCREYALSYSGQITYLRKPNGGLSDARNYGIRYVLSALPTVDAIYLLDADNRLRPTAMANAMGALDLNPQAGWIYPNIDMFGLAWAGDYGGDYSLLIHTQMNICEAGSLIRRTVFESGIFFDTSFKSGFEDWDFFLCAASAGFRGKNIEDFGFQYRKRAESMLAESERDGAAIRWEMRKKHKALFSPRGLTQLEQEEAPRYALILSDKQEVIAAMDPYAPGAKRLSLETFEKQWWTAQSNCSHHHVPPIVVVTHSDVVDQLRISGTVHFALWALERQLAQHPLSALEIDLISEDRIGYSEGDAFKQQGPRLAMLMVRPQLFREVAQDTSIAWISGLAADPCPLHVPILKLRLPASIFLKPTYKQYNAAGHDLVALAIRFQASSFRVTSNWKLDWREAGVPWRNRSHEVSRTPTQADAAYPRLAGAERHVGFVLPLVEFGGVERVALNIARAMKKAGWKPHLFVVDAHDCQYGREWREIFESVTFLADAAFTAWGSAQDHYMGTDLPDWSRSGDQRNAIAMLAWLDLAINFHGGAISGVMGQLKRFGVKTALSLHLSDRSKFQRFVGNPYLGLAFEHAYDFILPCSQYLADWCHGMGVPSQKIIPLLNAPAFELPDAAALQRQAPREPASSGRPLRVIYLGRLDRQKGIERLIAIFETAKALGLRIEWRFVGKAVIEGDDAVALPEHMLAMVEPALLDPGALARAFEWADVFLLPSYYEGLPLTILEAMRAGTVPLVTDAGAVTEVVSSWRNGIVLPQEGAVPEAIAALERLLADPALVHRLSQQARMDMAGRTWDSAVAPLLERLNVFKADGIHGKLI
ncbi:glycosyltransferase [Bordetella petrii]|nr:glycosyltransferase [Bordetella petrii]